MIRTLAIYAIAAVLLSSCSVMRKFETEKVPDDFIIEQDTTDVVFALNQLFEYDHQVIFEHKQHVLNESEKARLRDWLQVSQPSMIGVRGTGGAPRHRELGYKRATQIISYLQSQDAGVDAVLQDYDASLLGGRALLTIIPDALAEKIKVKAPILVITSN